PRSEAVAPGCSVGFRFDRGDRGGDNTPRPRGRGATRPRVSHFGAAVMVRLALSVSSWFRSPRSFAPLVPWLLALALAVGLGAPARAADAPRPPNVVFIL